MSEKKFEMKNWKGFASRYVRAMENLMAAQYIADNEEVKDELRKMNKKLEKFAELLDRDNDS